MFLKASRKIHNIVEGKGSGDNNIFHAIYCSRMVKNIRWYARIHIMEKVLYGEAYARVQSRDIPRTLTRMLERHVPFQDTDRVLEIGCGNGALFPFLLRHTPHVYGVDINKWLLVSAGNPNTVVGDARRLPFGDGSFDKTISVHTLEHIDHVQGVFEELDRVTKNKGLSIHIFPGFLFTKVEGAILETIRMFPFNPWRAWEYAHQLHVNDLTPNRVTELTQNTNWQLKFSKRLFVPETKGLNWIIILEK